MPVKRRNHGRSRPPKSRGKSKNVRCCLTGKVVAKDKAIKRFTVRNMVDASSMRDLQEASAIEGYVLPKFYAKMYYSVDAAVHRRIVRGRSRVARKNRDPPVRRRRPMQKKKEGEKK